MSVRCHTEVHWKYTSWRLCGVGHFMVVLIGIIVSRETFAAVVPKKQEDQAPVTPRQNTEQRALVEQTAGGVVLITIIKPGAGQTPVYCNTVTAPPDAQALVTSGIMVENGLVCMPAGRVDAGDRIIVTIDSEHKEPSDNGRLAMSTHDYEAAIVRAIPELGLVVLKIHPRDNERFPQIRLGNDIPIAGKKGTKNNWFIVVGKAKGERFVSQWTPGNRAHRFSIWASLLRDVTFIEMDGEPRLEVKAHFPAVLPENNGGAIVGRDGKLVGMALCGFDEYGLPTYWGIPISVIRRVMRAVVPNMDHVVGDIQLGVEVQDNQHEVPKSVRKILGTAFSASPAPSGCVVTKVQVGSAAHRAGTQPNDIVLLFDGRPVWNAKTYWNLERYSFGEQTVLLKVMRKGRLEDVTVTR